MSSACKRIKLNQTIKWNPILAQEYLNTSFTFRKFLIGDIKEPKKLSNVVAKLHEIYPLKDYYAKFKRVKNLNFSKSTDTNEHKSFQILLCPKDEFFGLPKELEGILTDLNEYELPIDKILTKKQYELVNKTYWPMSFHLDKHIESLLDQNDKFFSDEQKLKYDFYMRVTLELAESLKVSSAALFVDPRTDVLVALGIDRRNKHPLNHSTIDALRNVSQRHLTELKNTNINQQVNIEDINKDLKIFLEEKIKVESDSKYAIIKENLNKNLNLNDYLCTNYIAFLTHEPCSMCSMALVHSRVSNVFYVFNTKHGYLHTSSRIHCLPNLNHNYEVFQAENFNLDSGCASYFIDEATKHKNFSDYHK